MVRTSSYKGRKLNEKLSDNIEEMDPPEDGPLPPNPGVPNMNTGMAMSPEIVKIQADLARKNIRNNVAMGIFTAHVEAKGLPTRGHDTDRRIIDDTLMKAFYAAEVWLLSCEETLSINPVEEEPDDGHHDPGATEKN